MPPEQHFPFDVFLCHSSKDKVVVREIAARLKQDGVRVWFDEDQIKPGDHVAAKIDEGLENSRVLVFCMSAHSMGADWAQLEAQTHRHRDPINRERRFLPLRLDQAPIKMALQATVHIDWNAGDREEAYEALLESSRGQQPRITPEQQAARERQMEKIQSLGHTNYVRSVEWSANGRRALSGSDDNIVRLWEVESGQCLRVLEGHSKSVNSVAWRADSRLLLSGSVDETIRLWDVESGKCLRVLEGHTDSVWSVSWCADGRHALSGSADNTLRLWEVESGNCLRVLEGHTKSVYSLGWSVDDRSVLSGSADNTVRLWDVDSGQCLRVLEGHTDSVLNVAWSADGRRALSGSADDTVRLWDVDSGQCLRVLEGHTSSVLSVAWSADGRRALSGSADNTVRLWDVESGQCLRVLEGHTSFVLSVAWSANGRRALSGSADNTMRLWEVDSGKCLRVAKGHTKPIRRVAWSANGRRALSGSEDKTVRLWNVGSGLCLNVLEGHTASVYSVAWSGDDRRALSGSEDKTVRLWDVDSGQSLRVLEGHTASVFSVALSADGRRALSGSADDTVRLWELGSGKCLRMLEGHTGSVLSVAWRADNRRALSGSYDKTVRLWDVDNGQCLRVLEGHTDWVWTVAWSADGRRALSGSHDMTVRLWDMDSGKCLRVLEGHTASVLSVAWSADGKRALSAARNGVMRVWDLASDVVEGTTAPQALELPAGDGTDYTNAKVLVVGDTHAGKTGLTHRLATGQWKPSDESTVGAWSTQWALKDNTAKAGTEREIWLWDFGGQADQRLIHQLYLDGSALILQLFDADTEDVLPGLRDWQTALRRCVKEPIPQFLIAGRIDAGFKASKTKIKAHASEQKMKFFETSAKEGTGCEELRQALIEAIPWDRMTKRTSPRIFKLIKDEILKLRDQGEVLHTFKELREELWRRLPDEPRFSDDILRTVIGLLDGPGVVKELDYGTYILLAPEWINSYAQAVLRTLRTDDKELGTLPLRSIAEGKLLYHYQGRDGSEVKMRRLPEADERVVLGEMEKQLEERGLCLRQGDKLVFPSHCGRDRPEMQTNPVVFVSYTVKGFLDDIYATLVVKLADCGAFTLKELWRDAADFVTLEGDHHMGIKLRRLSGCDGEISIYFGPGVSTDNQVIFANYIHAHLHGACEEEPRRLRHYVCPHCHTAKGNPEALMQKLMAKKEKAEVVCDVCDKSFKLWDTLEKKFASKEVGEIVFGMQMIDSSRLTTRRQGKLLVLEVGARITSANQKWFEIPTEEDDGIDIQMEFTDEAGNGVGKGLCLQLKAGNSYLNKRKTDGVEVFTIKKQRWVKTWMNQPFPVMLVIGTLPEDRDHLRRRDRLAFESVRWMEITSVLKKLTANGTKRVTQIEFHGEEVNLTTVMRARERALQAT